MSCYFSQLLAETRSCDFRESLKYRVPSTSFSGDTEIAVSNPLWWAEMPRGYLFPDLIPNRNISQRYLAKLTREGSYNLGGFHCLSQKDRSTWGYDNTMHIYYIHVRTVVREINKGLKCVKLEYWSCLPLEWDWSLLELSPLWEPTREVLTTPLQRTLKWPGVRRLLGPCHHLCSWLLLAKEGSRCSH